MFVVVLLTIGVQMARGHDPALGTTPRPTAAAVQPAAPVAPDGGQAAPQPPVQYQQPQYPLPQCQQPPAAQTTTS